MLKHEEKKPDQERTLVFRCGEIVALAEKDSYSRDIGEAIATYLMRNERKTAAAIIRAALEEERIYKPNCETFREVFEARYPDLRPEMEPGDFATFYEEFAWLRRRYPEILGETSVDAAPTAGETKEETKSWSKVAASPARTPPYTPVQTPAQSPMLAPVQSPMPVQPMPAQPMPAQPMPMQPMPMQAQLMPAQQNQILQLQMQHTLQLMYFQTMQQLLPWASPQLTQQILQQMQQVVQPALMPPQQPAPNPPEQHVDLWVPLQPEKAALDDKKPAPDKEEPTPKWLTFASEQVSYRRRQPVSQAKNGKKPDPRALRLSSDPNAIEQLVEYILERFDERQEAIFAQVNNSLEKSSLVKLRERGYKIAIGEKTRVIAMPLADGTTAAVRGRLEYVAYVESSPCAGILVKNREWRFGVRDREIFQSAVYAQLLGLKRALIVEQFNGAAKITRLRAEELKEKWDALVLSRALARNIATIRDIIANPRSAEAIELAQRFMLAVLH